MEILSHTGWSQYGLAPTPTSGLKTEAGKSWLKCLGKLVGREGVGRVYGRYGVLFPSTTKNIFKLSCCGKLTPEERERRRLLQGGIWTEWRWEEGGNGGGTDVYGVATGVAETAHSLFLFGGGRGGAMPPRPQVVLGVVTLSLLHRHSQ